MTEELKDLKDAMTDELRTVIEAVLALYQTSGRTDAKVHVGRLRALLEPEGPKTEELTPYAVLMALSSDTDEQIRKLYHATAKTNHPDASADHQEGSRWAATTAAYNALKTQELRVALARAVALLSGQCQKCSGTGTIGSRRFKPGPRLCPECKGCGRC
jgi:hypothetical protein